MPLPWTMHSRGMEGCRGPSTAASHSLRSLGYAQDDLGLSVGILSVGKVLVRAIAQPALMVLRTSLVLLLSLGVRGYGIH
jgi:hypothetical protein